MYKKIIGVLSAVTLLGGAVYLSGQGGFGSLSSSVLGDEEVCSVESYIEQIQTVENNITLAQEKIQTQQQSIQKNNENITTLSQTLRERQAALKQAQANKKKCGTGRSTNQACVKQADTYIANLQDAIKNLENKIKENKAAISETKKNITTQQKNIKTWKRNIASLSQEKTQCEEKINTVNPETGGDLPPANPETGGDLPPYVPETGGDLPPANPETGGDLPPYVPETGGDLPQATDTQTNTTPPATMSTPMTDTILVDATIDTFDKLRVESAKLSTSYNLNTVFSEDKLNEIAGRFDILSATLVALKEGTSEGGNTASTDWDSVLKSLYAQRNSIEPVEETIWRKQQLNSLINNYKALKKKSKNATSIETSARIEGIGLIKISNDNDIAKVNNLIKVQDQILAQKNQQLGTINTQIQQAITAQASQKKSAEQREKLIKESAAQIEQVEMYLGKVRSLVESFRTGKDNETTCSIHADWKPLDNTLVERSKATLNKFAPGRTNLEHLTAKKPISSSLAPKAEEAYDEIKNVLGDLENELSRYESQDNTSANPAPVECLQWWNAEKQKRNNLATSNGKLSVFKPQVVEFRRFITWMDQNHFSGNN